MLVADENAAALDQLAAALASLGHEITPYAVDVRQATRVIASADPDLAVVMVHRNDEHALALIDEAVEYASGPVIVHAIDADAEFIAQAAEHGISAYAETTDPEALQGAIEVALHRHREAARLTERIDQLETALERRGTIERAKGILMERHSIDDRSAFELLREFARSHNRRVVDVSRAVSEGQALLPRD